LAKENFAVTTMYDWAAVCRHVKAMEEDDMSREHEMDSVIERIIINTDKDEDDTSESSISCNENDDIQVIESTFQ
jgi:hypothetical protein